MTTPTVESDEVVFTIAYDGPALAAGRMPLLELAPAMLSTAQLVEDGVRLLYGPTAAVKIEVNADFKRGSFEYDVFTGPHSVGNLLSKLSAQDVDYALKWLGLTGTGGALALIKWLRNRKVKSVEKTESDARITTSDGDNIIVHANVANLTFNTSVREDVNGMLQPLRAKGITEFRSGQQREAAVVIRDSEAEYFVPPPSPEREMQDVVREEVIAPTFRENNKWKFAQGELLFHAAVLDKAFLAQVDRHEFTFGKGDALRVELRTRVTQDAGGLSALREVVRVIEKIPPPSNPDLFDAPPTLHN